MATGRKKSPTPPPEGKRILNAIRQLVRALRLFDREAQAKHGISAAQMFVLHALSEEDGISLNTLAERTATDQSSASVVVQRLVDGGYLTRTAQEEDRRHIVLRLTAKGRAVTRRSPPPTQQRIIAAVETMSVRDRIAFADMLETFVDSVGVKGKKAPMLFEEDK
jgi:MarR family transcriptional regulator, organic hydroperoxide resistance regulator